MKIIPKAIRKASPYRCCAESVLTKCLLNALPLALSMIRLIADD